VVHLPDVGVLLEQGVIGQVVPAPFAVEVLAQGLDLCVERPGLLLQGRTGAAARPM
jgi:hypothetical protein